MRVFGWMLIDKHPVFIHCSKTFLKITLTNFISEIEKYVLCCAVSAPDPSKAMAIQRHVLPRKCNFREF